MYVHYSLRSTAVLDYWELAEGEGRKNVQEDSPPRDPGFPYSSYSHSFGIILRGMCVRTILDSCDWPLGFQSVNNRWLNWPLGIKNFRPTGNVCVWKYNWCIHALIAMAVRCLWQDHTELAAHLGSRLFNNTHTSIVPATIPSSYQILTPLTLITILGIGTIITSILEMGKLRHRLVK